MPWWTPFLAAEGTAAFPEIAGALRYGITAPLGPIERNYTANANYGNPNVIPDPVRIIWAYRIGEMEFDQAKLLLRWHGIPFDRTDHYLPGMREDPLRRLAARWEEIFASQEPQPTVFELHQFLNRERITEAEFRGKMRRLGFMHQPTIDNYLDLRFQIPGPSDLVRFAVREVWDPAVVERYGYDAEFPPQVAYWLRRQGFGGDARSGDEIAAGAAAFEWARAYWRAHWQPLAPSQAYEMYQRLRPERIGRFQAQFPGIRPFTLQDVETWLKVDDYPPAVRQQLAAMSLRVPDRRDITRAFEIGIIAKPELIAFLRDRGYSPADASMLGDFYERFYTKKRTTAIVAGARANILKAYKAGAVARVDAAFALYRVEFAGTVTLDDFEAMDPGQQLGVVDDNAEIAMALDQADLDERLRLVAETVKQVRDRRLKGWLSRAEANIALQRVGVVEPRKSQLLNHWDFELAGPRLALSTAKIQSYARLGILTFSKADEMLTNLGWPEQERYYLLLEVQHNLALDVARAQAKQAKSLAEQQAAYAKQIRELEREKKRIMADLIRQAGWPELRRQYVLGIITDPYLQKGLQRLELDADTVQRRMEEARRDRFLFLETQRAKRLAQLKKEGKLNGKAPQAPTDGAPAK